MAKAKSTKRSTRTKRTSRVEREAQAEEQRRRARLAAPVSEPPVTVFEYIVEKANEGLALHEAKNAKPKGTRAKLQRQRKLAVQRAKPASERAKAKRAVAEERKHPAAAQPSETSRKQDR